MINSTIYVMESANLICGDTNQGGKVPGNSTHLVLQELKLPSFEENYVDHNAGGAMVGIEVPSHINKLESTFNLAGWDPEVMKLLARNEPLNQTFTAYGLIRDRRSSQALQAMAVMNGRLGRVNPAPFSKGNLMHHEFSIKSITHYRLTMKMTSGAQATEIYYWDFFESEFRSGSIALSNDLHNTLAFG